MKRVLISIALFVLILGSTSLGFDNQRKGFVLGGGLGIAPYSNWSIDLGDNLFGGIIDFSADETNVGPALNFVIGYAWNEQNMIVYHADGLIYKSDFFDQSAVQTFNGVSFFHYFGPVGRAPFAVVGVGGYGWKVEELEANDVGPALLVGAGYEFARHVQVGAYYVGGRTSDKAFGETFNFGHAHVSVAVTAVAF